MFLKNLWCFEQLCILLNISETLKATWITFIYLERGRTDEKNVVLHLKFSVGVIQILQAKNKTGHFLCDTLYKIKFAQNPKLLGRWRGGGSWFGERGGGGIGTTTGVLILQCLPIIFPLSFSSHQPSSTVGLTNSCKIYLCFIIILKTKHFQHL